MKKLERGFTLIELLVVIYSNAVTSAGDASDPDINWTCNGVAIP